MADEWSLEANMERGCLPTGEPLECLYGPGPWSREPEPDWPPLVQCHRCSGNAYDLGDRINCEDCGIISCADEEETDGD